MGFKAISTNRVIYGEREINKNGCVVVLLVVCGGYYYETS